MSTIYIIRKKDLIIGIYNDLNIFIQNTGIEEPVPEFIEDQDTVIICNYSIEKVKLNQINIRPNQIIYKGKEFNLNNLDEPLPLLDVSDPTYL